MEKVTCDNCGKVFSRRESAIREHNFCSRGCCGEWLSKNFRGENNPNYKGGAITRICEECGAEFSIPQAWLRKKGKNEGRFCSKECREKWLSNYLQGSNNPNYIPESHITVKCIVCRKSFSVPRAWVKGERKFCSRECFSKWLSEHLVGENNPNWKGGFEPYYGCNWDTQRRRTLERDQYQCHVCGKKREEMYREPDVHHIIPLREFDTPEEANTLDNLITLCPKCHKKVEARTPQIIA